MTVSPDVTIIIPTFQGAKWLDETLSAIQNQNYDGKVEILTIDSGSTDGTLQILESHATQLITIQQAEFNHSYVRNLGAHKAQTDILIFMSQDALPVGEEWLHGLVSLLDDQAIGAAFCRQLPRPDATPLEEFFYYEMYPSQNKRFSLGDKKNIQLADQFFSNVCSVTRRELVLKYPFPEDLIMSEDQAFAKSLLIHGYDTYYSGEVEVIHSHHYSLSILFRRNFDSAYSLKQITDDNLGSTVKNGLSYLFREFIYLLRYRHWLAIVFMPFYELTRISGFLLGGQAERLPSAIRYKMSYHRSYWQNKTFSSEDNS